MEDPERRRRGARDSRHWAPPPAPKQPRMTHSSRGFRLGLLGLLGLGALLSPGCATCLLLGGSVIESSPELASPCSGIRFDRRFIPGDAPASHGWGDVLSAPESLATYFEPAQASRMTGSVFVGERVHGWSAASLVDF